jgi:hypothetical protein
MPGYPGVTVVTNSCVCLFSHTRLRVHWPPGIPCALSFLGAEGFYAQLGRIAPRDRGGASANCAVITREPKSSSPANYVVITLEGG